MPGSDEPPFATERLGGITRAWRRLKGLPDFRIPSAGEDAAVLRALEEASEAAREGEDGRALQRIQAAVEQYPRAHILHIVEAALHSRRGDPGAAARSLAVAIAIEPDDPTPYRRLARPLSANYIVPSRVAQAGDSLQRELQTGDSLGPSAGHSQAFASLKLGLHGVGLHYR